MSTLRLQFESSQQFQLDAISSIVDVFEGQSLKQSKFTVAISDGQLFGKHTELGFANRLDLLPEDLLRNVITIQDRNRLARSTGITDDEYGVPNFAIEMETGTGKTYVYTRTIMELNKKYGMTKFIIVVPSVAIREGVKKSLDVTREHFELLYPGQALNSFIYNSDRLTEVRSFATSEGIEIMIINIDAFRKSFQDEAKSNKNALRIHKEQDKLEGRRPIEFIAQTNPIVIIDEPQSVDGTDKSKEAIKSLNPLCIFRYSATHKKTYNLMYKLGPIEAYENKLVKAIEVVAVGDDNAGPYLKLEKVSNAGGTYSAMVTLNVVDSRGESQPKLIKINTTTRNNLYTLSGRNDQYRGYVVIDINADPSNGFIEFEDRSILKLSESTSSTDVVRAQIATTIETHLDKEVRLLEKEIKVLSLFFLDKVSNYREYDEAGNATLGMYAQIFEEEYLRIVRLPKYRTLFSDEKYLAYSLNENVSEVHDGYFSQDKKGKLKDSTGEGTTQDDASTYDLIMKNKEDLLSFDTKLRFIFSHSALKEGWDNPNVFQVCTLVETRDTMTKRQKVGRGLRLPVYSDGEHRGRRVIDDSVNILTIVANESFKSFAESLQHEIEKDTNTKFGVITERLFENILRKKGDVLKEVGYESSKRLHDFLKAQGLIDGHDKAKEELKELIRRELEGENVLVLPEEFREIRSDVVEQIRQTMKRLPILNQTDRVNITINKEVFLGVDFRQLWDQIKHKTSYRLDFDSTALIKAATEALPHIPEIRPSAIVAQFINLQIEKTGVTFGDPTRIRSFARSEMIGKQLPDIVRYIERYTGLKRSSIAKILTDSKTLDSFYINPQEYMEQVILAINEQKRKMIVDGIKYERIGDDVFFEQSLFEKEELIGYLDKNAVSVESSVFSHVLYDSDNEKSFAERLAHDDDVKVFAKLPAWFVIDTPLGTYNPDWAVVLLKEGVEKLYFVLETKGSLLTQDLRGKEEQKIQCGRKHFEALETEARYTLANDYDEWRQSV